jgi:hypothetical protein
MKSVLTIFGKDLIILKVRIFCISKVMQAQEFMRVPSERGVYLKSSWIISDVRWMGTVCRPTHILG